MVKRTITITTILLVLSITVGLIIALNRASFAADDDIASGTSGTCSWVIDKDGVLTISPTDGVSGTLDNTRINASGYNNDKWFVYNLSVKKVIVNPGVKVNTIGAYLFYDFRNCTEMDISNLDTSQVTNMKQMFYYCSNLTALDLSGFDTSNVKNMYGMFWRCSSLTNLNVAGFNTSKVTDMSDMFNSCSSLTSLDVTGFDTNKVTSMGGVFNSCSALTTLDVTGFDTSNVESMYGMFWRCSSLTNLNVAGFNTSKVTSMNYMFCGCTALTSIDVTGFDTSSVADMFDMFGNCKNLTSVDLSNFDTSNVIKMGSMFCGCSKITELNLNSFNTSSLSGGQAIDNMFEGCTNLKRLDLNHFDVSGVTDFQSIFSGCEKLEQINVKDWDVSNGTKFDWTFKNCSNLINLDLSGWNTSSATDMAAMFSKCSSLETLNISNFDTRNVKDFNGFFHQDINLSSIKVGPNFDPIAKTTSSVDRVNLKTESGYLEYIDYWSREDNAYGPFLAEEWNTLFDRETMYGVWKRTRTPRPHSVEYFYSFRPRGVSDLPEKKYYLPGDEVIVADKANAPGYIFTGWQAETSVLVEGIWETEKVTIIDGKFTMPQSDVGLVGDFVEAGYVEYYVENLEVGKYELKDRIEVERKDIIDEDTYRWIYNITDYNHEIEGFNYEYVEEDWQNYTLKLYYKRNSYNISYSYTGEVPDAASELPKKQTYKYEEEISLPENPSAPGYTFSGWHTDYITMPAEDIEITGYFIKDDVSKEYKIEYYFDGEKDDSLDETMNAEINQEVSIDPQKSLNFNNTHYSLVSNNHKISVSENTENNIIRVYYETDVLDYRNEKSTSGDGISDKYQVKIIYKVQNGTWNDGTSEDKKQIINLYDKDGNPAENGTGKITIPQVGNKPAEGYSKGSWNAEIPEVVSNKDNEKEFIYSYAKIGSISKIKGNLSNPKTDDIVQSYALYGAIAILLMLVVKRTINKYSRKKRKIQF